MSSGPPDGAMTLEAVPVPPVAAELRSWVARQRDIGAHRGLVE